MSATTLFKVFVDAAKETPRLYFAPIVEAIRAVNGVQETMVNGKKKSIRARTLDHATIDESRSSAAKRKRE